MSKDTILNNLDIVDNLTTNSSTEVLSAGQGRELGLAVNVDKNILDTTVVFTSGDTLFEYPDGDVTFKLIWVATPKQFGFVYDHAGVDPQGELVFSYTSSKNGTWLVDGHRETISASASNRFYNPADLTTQNTDMALDNDGDVTTVTGSLSLSDDTFAIEFYMSIFRSVDYLPALTTMACVSGWRWVSTG